jgi:kynureninase
MNNKNDLAFALEQDKKDELSPFRNKFFIPELNGKPVLYFTGNSLGLQPKGAKKALEVELEDWAKYGVEGHFNARNPWFSYHERFTKQSAELVGALPEEVVVMNGLTVNLHLLLVSFYRPKGKRVKIICEQKAFPSDQYALESQVRFHGYDPADTIVEVGPREGEHLIREEDILEVIHQTGDELALVMIGGVNYYSGQFFNLKNITTAGHAVGAQVGFDLAHAAGNVPLHLHDDQVDFACWCSYKYLNSGPGSVSGAFVHEKHANDTTLPRFAGWWGYDKSERFQMESGFRPIPGAEGWQLSNAPVLAMAVHKVALDLFSQAGMPALRKKSEALTDYMEFIIQDIAERKNINLEIITPQSHEQRGCQLSVLAHGYGKKLFDKLTEKGVVADWREPNVIRMAPVPLYNSFQDIFEFGQILENALD